MHQRDIIDAKSRKKPTAFNKVNATIYRNMVTNMKSNLKSQYYANAISDAKGNTKKLWKALKSMLNVSPSSICVSDIEGCDTPEDIAARFNEFFSNIGPELAKNIPPSLIDLDLTPLPDIPLFDLKEVTQDEVRKILSNISSAKATGEDGVCVRLMKLNLDTIAMLLTHIVNVSIRTLKVLYNGRLQ